MQHVTTVAELREIVTGWKEAGASVGLVPTMGNLHKGHMSLVQIASEQSEHVIVSIFVNPTQFGPAEDFASYPRTPEMDNRRLARAQVDVVFEPSVEEMYPFGSEGAAQVVVPELSDILCGETRPGHFVGVTSVVSRLFNICMPDLAVFGQKDYQQLVILRRMCADLHEPTQIIAAPTERTESGLALSSRNSYLDEDQQETATVIYKSLCAARDEIEAGEADFAALECEGRDTIAAAGLEPEYFVIRRARDLAEPESGDVHLVVLTEARYEGVRLLDNVLAESGV